MFLSDYHDIWYIVASLGGFNAPALLFLQFWHCTRIVYHFCSIFIVTNWNSLILNGSWRGSTAGGCRNFPTFTDNPQYAIDLTEDADGDGKCSVLIALMQKNRRQQKKLGVRDLCIGYAVYKVTAYYNSLWGSY